MGTAASAITYTITNTGANASGVTVTSNNSEFVVSSLSSTTINNGATATYNVTFTPSETKAYYAWIYDEIGRPVCMWPNPSDLTINPGKDISNLSNGVYLLKIMDESNKETVTKKFIKQ